MINCICYVISPQEANYPKQSSNQNSNKDPEYALCQIWVRSTEGWAGESKTEEDEYTVGERDKSLE